MQGEVGRLRGEVEDARETSGTEEPTTEPTAQGEEVRAAGSRWLGPPM